MRHPIRALQRWTWPSGRSGFARLGAACRDHLGRTLLQGMVCLLPLLLALVDPAAALESVAVAPGLSAPVGLRVLSRAVADPRSSAHRVASLRTGVVVPFAASAIRADRAAAAEGSAQPEPDAAASLPALFQQALEASRSGRFDLALPLWNRVLALAPNDAAAWSNRGNVQLALGDPLAAIADQDQALLLEPGNADPHLNRGTAEEALGRWDDAAADYAWILERDPLDASALYNLGNVQGSRGDWQAARESFVAAADARPGFAMARSSAALAVFQLGDLAVAERELRSLIRRYPLFADARAGLTALLWQRGAAGEAESNWAAASGLDPRYRQSDWLLSIRRWPPGPVVALERFLQLDG